MIRFTEAEFQELEQFMRSQYGIDLSKKRTLSECRLSAELEKEGITSLQQFMRRMELDKTKRLENMMLDKLTTNYTFFMRESKHFDYLRENILPTLRPDNTGPFYRVWSAGCSTGEECYTLSMLLHDYTRQGGFLPFFGDHGNGCLGGRGQGGERGGLSHAGACGYPAPLAGEIR